MDNWWVVVYIKDDELVLENIDPSGTWREVMDRAIDFATEVRGYALNTNAYRNMTK